MSHQKIRIGVLGAGGYGRTARKYLRACEQFEIVACMDVDRAAADLAAEDERAVPYADLDAFLGHADIQAVSINTPATMHAQHIQWCLEAGKHVLVTKPVTKCLDDAQRLCRLAQDQHLALMVGHHLAHTPLADRLKTELSSARVGRLCNVLVTCCSSAGLAQRDGAWRTLAGQNPGGPLLQCGIHFVHLLISLLGRVEGVRSMAQRDVTPNDTIDNLLLLMQFPRGVQAAMMCNYTTAYLHTLSFMGTAGNLHVQEHITGLGETQLYFQPRHHGTHEPWQSLELAGPTVHDSAIERSFADQIRCGQPDYTNLHLAIEALKVVHMADRNAASPQEIERVS